MPDNDWQAEIVLLQDRDWKSRAILGVSQTADRTEIRRAFRLASLAHHPDNNGASLKAHRKFIRVNCAHMFLTERKGCEELDAGHLPDKELTGGKYRSDNPWGYFAWWREKYFGLEKQESENAYVRISVQEMRSREFVSGKGREQESSRL